MDEETQTGGIGGWFKKNSTMLAIVVGGILLGVVFLKKPANDGSSSAVSPSGDWSGIEVDPYGNRVIYRDTGSQFINVSVENPTQPTASAPVTVNVSPSAPIEDPVESTTPQPYSGLLGPGVEIDFNGFKYRKAGQPWQPIPLPANTQLIAGKQGRVWYVQNNIQHLLTSGTGPPVTNSGYPVGSIYNNPNPPSAWG